MKRIRALVLLLAIMMSTSVLWAQKYDVVLGEKSTSVYFKIYQESTKNGNTIPAHAEVVAGEYQYTGIVTIPDFVTLDDIEYPVTVITEKCFANCKELKQVILGNKVETIKQYAFYFSGDASKLTQEMKTVNKKGVEETTVVTRNGIIINLDAPALTTVAANAFYVTSITPEDKVLRIGKNVSSLGDSYTTFMGWCAVYVDKIVVDKDNKNFTVGDDGVLYDINKTKLIMYPKLAPSVSYTTPVTVTNILSHAIYGPTLTSFTDGGGLTRVGSVDLGTRSISFGKNLKTWSDHYRLTDKTKINITIDSENPYFSVIEDKNHNRAIYALSGGKPVKLCKAFQQNGNKNGETEYNMNGNFGTDTFVLPTTVTTIASLAFYGCYYIKYVDCQNSTVLKASGIDDSAAPAPVSIKYINIKLYSEIEGQEGIEYADDNNDNPVKLVSWSSNAKVADYVMPSTVTSIAGSGMHDNTYAKTFDIGPNLYVGGNSGYFWRLSNLEKFTASRGNTKGLFVEGDALYLNDNGTISMISYPSGKKDMTYTVADGTKYLSGNTGTPAVSTFKNKYLRAVDLGDDMVEIRYKALKDMTQLAVVRISAPVAPTASSGSFEGTASATTKKSLCVPAELIDIYKNNSVFSTCFKVFADKDMYDQLVREVEVEYDIQHYKQNLEDDEYEKVGLETKVKGNLLAKTNATAYIYTGADIKGFKVASIEDFDLTDDGITANIYYDRELYKVTWKNGESVVSEATERYQTPLTVPSFDAPAGKNLIGWHSNPEATVGLPFEGAQYVENITYYALLADNATVKYTVKHLLQNLEDDNYTEDVAAKTESEGIWGLQTQASAKPYPGYTAQTIEQKTIAEDGSTVVEIKYDRDNYTVTWMNGSTQMAKDTKRFGAALTAPTYPTPAPTGKHYIGWNTDKDAQTAITLPTVYDATATYYVISVDNATVKYTVQHKLQNITGNAYILEESDNGTGIAGTMTKAKAKDYTGFEAQSFTQKSIAEDESTVVEILYNRNSYDVVWKNGDATLASDKLVYGSPVSAPTEPSAPAGKHFAGWNTDKNGVDGLKLSEATVQGPTTYYAIYLDNATVDYTVIHKTESLNGNYVEKATATGKGIVGLNTNVVASSFDGFTAQDIEQAVIKEDGTTEVVVLYSRNSYTLKYENLEGATIENSSEYTKAGLLKYEQSIVVPKLNREGYTYVWKGSVPTQMPCDNVTLSVEWSQNVYKEHWDFNNGKGEKLESPNKFGEPITKPDGIPSKEWYEFIGWARQESPTEVIENDDFGVMPAADVYFVAVFAPSDVNYTVAHKFESVDGSSYVEDASMRETKSTKYNATSEAQAKDIEGFTALTISQKTINDNNIVVEVNYKRDLYNLTWVNDEASATIDNEDSYTKGGQVKFGTPIVAPVYKYAGHSYTWNATIPTTMPTSDVTLSTLWDAIAMEYTIVHKFESVDGSEYETDDNLTENKKVKYGSTSEAQAKSIEGFTPMTIAQKTINAENIVVEVKYNRDTYTLTWVSEKSAASITNDATYTKSGSVKYGTSIVAPEYSLEGHEYAWNGAIPETMPASDVVLTAIWSALSVDYTVVHLFENLSGDYVEDEELRETLSTSFGSTSDAKAKDINGFVANTITQKTINAKDIVIEVTYDRSSYFLTWINLKPEAIKTNEGLYTESGYVKVGTPIVAPIFSLEGATYSWNGEVPSVMPSHDVQLSVVWDIDETTAIEAIDAEEATIAVKGKTIIVTVPSKQTVRVVNMAGQVLFNEAIESQATITLDAKGVYVVTTPSLAKRVLIR